MMLISSKLKLCLLKPPLKTEKGKKSRNYILNVKL